MTARTFNVTKISKVIYFGSVSEFSDYIKSEDLSQYTLSVVKVTDNISALFYGNRQLKDSFLVESYPDSPDYPLNKLYINRDSEIYYKYEDSQKNIRVADITSTYFKSVNKDTEGNLKVVLSDGTPLVISSEVNSQVVENISSQVDQEIQRLYRDGDILWEVWS